MKIISKLLLIILTFGVISSIKISAGIKTNSNSNEKLISTAQTELTFSSSNSEATAHPESATVMESIYEPRLTNIISKIVLFILFFFR